MSVQPKELSTANSHQFELKQPNKTKKIILLNNGLLDNNPRGNSDINPQNNFRGNEALIKPKSLHYEPTAAEKLVSLANEIPQFDRRLNYSHLFWKMYLQNEIVVAEMRQSITKSKEVQAKIAALEHECKELERNLNSSSKKETKKKNRRTANEIQKNFVCPYQNCNKNYGSDVSLNLHIKLKHNGGNKTEREKLARTIFLAKINGEQAPEISLNLPPGFLENMNKSKLLKDKGNRKERSASKDNDFMTKSETSRPLEGEEPHEMHTSHDSHSMRSNSETQQKQNDFQDFSTRPGSLMLSPSLITTK